MKYDLDNIGTNQRWLYQRNDIIRQPQKRDRKITSHDKSIIHSSIRHPIDVLYFFMILDI